MQHLRTIYTTGITAARTKQYKVFQECYSHFKDRGYAAETLNLLDEVIKSKDVHLFRSYAQEISMKDAVRLAIQNDFEYPFRYWERKFEQDCWDLAAIGGKFKWIRDRGNRTRYLLLGLQHPDSIDFYCTKEHLSDREREALHGLCSKCGYSETAKRLAERLQSKE